MMLNNTIHWVPTGPLERDSVLRAMVWIVLILFAVLPTGAHGLVGGVEVWDAAYDGPASGPDWARALALDPGGGKVYVTGVARSEGPNSDYATVAYDALTGAHVWESRYDGAAGGLDVAQDVAVSPLGDTVFVTGYSASTSADDFVTVAYDAASGAERWSVRYDGSAGGVDQAVAVGVSSDGAVVFVTGHSAGTGTYHDYATLAYDAASGAELWSARHDGPAGSWDRASALVVDPDDETVVVTGYTTGYTAYGTGTDYTTVAYDAATGDTLWTGSYNGPLQGLDRATAIATDPGGDRLFVTGVSYGAFSSGDYATVAYDAATGEQQWVARYEGDGGSYDLAQDVQVSPDGLFVYVAGYAAASGPGRDYATLAYSTLTGQEVWHATYNGPAHGNDIATGLAVDPLGHRVHVTGYSAGVGSGTDYATVSYDRFTGIETAVARHDGAGGRNDYAAGIAVDPVGARVYVTGTMSGDGTSFDYGTVSTLVAP